MPERKPRILVTGIGAVSSFGVGVDRLWNNLLSGENPSTRIPERFRAYYKPTSNVWAPLPEFDWAELGFGRAEQIKHDPSALIQFTAIDEALSRAQINTELIDRREQRYELTGLPKNRIGVFIGTGLGGSHAPFDNYVPHLLKRHEKQLQSLADKDRSNFELSELLQNISINNRVNPFVICQTMPNAITASVGIRYGAKGRAEVACYACAASTIAIVRAFEAISRGEVDLAIVGGVEHFGDRAGGVFMGFDMLKTLAHSELGPKQCNRPFDADRSGFLFSEGGAGAIVLETEELATRRRAEPLAELVATSTSFDARSIATIDENDNQIDRLLEDLLLQANVKPASIDYINAHATGTETNDRVEGKILLRRFGDNPVISASKSILGHTVGACGATEAIITVLTLFQQEVHPNLNLSEPIYPLNLPISRQKGHFDYGITQNMGFGGHNAALLFKRW